jgi:TPR repeat protein
MKKIFILCMLLGFLNLNATSFQRLVSVAQGGNPQAQYNLGMFYKNNKKDFSQAFRWIHKSALKGYVPAQYEFALMFHYGTGVRQNSQLARLWFNRAGKRGDLRAKSILYRFYKA